MKVSEATRKLTTMAMLTAISIVLVTFVHFPLLPAAPWMEYDPADIPIFIGTFLFDCGCSDYPGDDCQRRFGVDRYRDALSGDRYLCAAGRDDLPPPSYTRRRGLGFGCRRACDDSCYGRLQPDFYADLYGHSD